MAVDLGLCGLPLKTWKDPVLVDLRGEGIHVDDEKRIDALRAGVISREIPPPYLVLGFDSNEAAVAAAKVSFRRLQRQRCEFSMDDVRCMKYHRFMFVRGIMWQTRKSEDCWTNNLSQYFTDPQRYRAYGRRPGVEDKPTPHDLWHTQIGKVIHCATRYTKDKVLRFNCANREVFYLASACPNFRPLVATSLYRELRVHLPRDRLSCLNAANGLNVLDMSAGWGDRLIAAMSVEGITHYTGVDPNGSLHPSYRQIVHTFASLRSAPFTVSFVEDGAESGVIPTPPSGEYDIAFTSPPFFFREVYETGNPKQSVAKFGTLDSWKRDFLWVTIRRASELVRAGGFVALAAADYKGCEFMLDTVREVNGHRAKYGLAEWGMYAFGMYQDRTKHPQPIYVWRKL